MLHKNASITQNELLTRGI